MAAYIHHVQLCTRHGLKYVQKFVQNANFNLFAERSTDSLKQWAVKSGSTIFVINQPVKTNDEMHADDSLLNVNHVDSLRRPSVQTSEICSATNSYNIQCSEQEISQSIPLSCFSPSKRDQNIDSVFNIAFEVRNVEQFVERAQNNGARILCQPTVVHSESGQVVVASVQSCVGNTVHTILNTKDYGGIFLPGFSDSNHYLNDNEGIEVDKKRDRTLTTHLDHVTLATDIGESTYVMDWYERCFGMKRFKLSRDESDSEGFLVEGPNVGLRMKAMEYWRCAETGISMPHPDSGHPKAKFVIAEALPGQGQNQVETFLQEHGGPGIQHIGLYAPNIIDTVEVLKKNGLDFMQPPDAYYTEIGKLTEMHHVGENAHDLKHFGILLDAESFKDETQEKPKAIENSEQNGATSDKKHSYLMQIFTKPIFDRNTFFLEIIQRCGATGFGAGNITALWKAVEHYMKSNKNAL